MARLNLNNYWLLFIFFCFTRMLVFVLLDETPSLFVNHYQNAAINFLHGDGFSVKYENSLVPFTLYPPGFSLFIAVIYWLFGVHPFLVQVTQVLIMGVAIILFAKTIGILLKSDEKAIRFGYFYCLIPIFWTSDVSLNSGTCVAVAFSLISFYFLYGSSYSSRHLLVGLFAAMAVSARSEFILLVVVFFVLQFIKSMTISHFCLYLAGCLLILVPMSVRNYRNFKTLSPLPGGGGLTLVNVIGKFYPDYERGFAFGDGNVLKAEKGNYTDLTYPHPYERDKDRLARCFNFMAEHPGKFAMALARNTPRAWFGQQINLVDGPGFQEYLAGGGAASDFIRENPLKFADIFLGFMISLSLMSFAIYFLVDLDRGQFLQFLLPAGAFFIFFIVFGTLGRYTLPAYVFLSPVSFLGIEKALNKLQKFYKK